MIWAHFASRRLQMTVPVFLVLLIQTQASAEFGDVLIELGPASVPSGFGLSVDLSDDLVIVGAGDPKLQQFSDSASVFDLQTGNEVMTLFADENVSGFGTSVAIDGAYAIVGAVVLATSSEVGEDMGTAHVFDLESGDELFTLTPDDARPGQGFGSSVAIVDELNLALVGASRDNELRFNGGAVYVFDLDTGEQLQKLTTEQDPGNTGLWTMLGSSIAVDGHLAAFGELNSEIFDRSTRGGVALFDLSDMTFLRKYTNPEPSPRVHDLFGASLDMDGDRLVVGAPGVAGNLGAAFVFDVESGASLQKLTVDQLERFDSFGSAVALEGDIAAIATWNRGRAVYVVDASSGQVLRRIGEEAGLRPGGWGDTLAIDDGVLAIGARTNQRLLAVDVTRAGDFNQDGLVDVLDLDLLIAAVVMDSADLSFDLTQDDVLSIGDVEHWVHEVKGTYFGDTNLDGEFSTRDLIVALQFGEYEDGIMGNSTWATGDWDADADFTSGDLVIAFQDGGYEVGPRAKASAVPEPTPWAMLLAAGVIRVSRRKRGQASLGEKGSGMNGTVVL